MSLISCRNVALSYDGKTVVKNLNFTVDEGNYLCVLGENGSGKSTLIKGVLGLMKPTSGSITYGDGLRQNEIGYLPQQTVVQKDFPASVGEVVLSGCINRMGWKPFFSAAEKKTAAENMERLGIQNLKKHCYRELSGGQQQRVLLARALCATKKLLLLDEPVSGLDPVVTAEMYALIDSLNKNDGITVIMVSHDTQVATLDATHILHMKHEPLFFGTKDDYMSTEIGKKFMGGMPV